jgi:hypothetical protein
MLFFQGEPRGGGGEGAKYRKIDIHKINMSRLGAKDHLYRRGRGIGFSYFLHGLPFLYCTLLTVCRKGQLRWNSWKYSFVEFSRQNVENLRLEVFIIVFAFLQNDIHTMRAGPGFIRRLTYLHKVLV